MKIETIDVQKVSLRIFYKIRIALSSNDIKQVRLLANYKPSFSDKVKDFLYCLKFKDKK